MAETRVPEPPRIFADASVLIAGAASYTGASRALLTLAELGLITLVTCPYIQEEARRNLALKLPEAVPYFNHLQHSIAWETIDDPTQDEVDTWLEIVRTKDAPVLAAAVSADPDRFVTLDKTDFLESPEDSRTFQAQCLHTRRIGARDQKALRWSQWQRGIMNHHV